MIQLGALLIGTVIRKVTEMDSRRAWPLAFLAIVFVLLSVVPVSAQGQSAPGGPGTMPTWTPGNKDGVGTSTSTDSHVWFTLQGGVLSEVYYPRLDSADVRTLEFAVSDGKTVWVESKDLRHSVEQIDDGALMYRPPRRDPGGRFEISKTYATDPARDTLLIDVTFTGSGKISMYVFFDPALGECGGGDKHDTQHM